MRDGGPAFPRAASEYTENGTLHDGNRAEHAQPGMSLRDWFAGMALSGVCARFGGPNWCKQSTDALLGINDSDDEDGINDPKMWAEECYMLAYAMLAERERRNVTR